MDLYSSLIALVPDYDLVFALTSAGEETSGGLVQVLLSMVMKVLIPAIEQANR